MPLVIGAGVGCVMALLLDASIQVEDVGGLIVQRAGLSDTLTGPLGRTKGLIHD